MSVYYTATVTNFNVSYKDHFELWALNETSKACGYG